MREIVNSPSGNHSAPAHTKPVSSAATPETLLPMRMFLLAATLAIPAVAQATTDSSADETFYKQKKEAEANLQSSTGIEYDRIVGQAITGSGQWQPGVAKCLEANPAPQEIRGFIEFAADGTYKLVVRPTGAFADCVAAFVGRIALPKPPQLPYRQDFNFSTDY